MIDKFYDILTTCSKKVCVFSGTPSFMTRKRNCWPGDSFKSPDRPLLNRISNGSCSIVSNAIRDNIKWSIFYTFPRRAEKQNLSHVVSNLVTTKVVVMKLILFGFENRPKKPVFGPPKPVYGIPNPKPSYGIPIAPPSSTYGVAAPSNTYGVAPPSNTYGPGKPSSVYGIEPPPIDLTYGPPQQRLSASASQIHSQFVNAPNDDNLVCD